ncbi:MAG: hypothetical protein M3Y81_05820 [Chloroflexota bacterium]|nr:hypothetical protein [Chloroflexota bacterium]
MALSPNDLTPEKLAEVRQTALSLIERAKTDSEFKERIRQQPVDTLTDAGLPREAVSNWLRDSQLFENVADDVAGYDTICFGSICP